MAKYFVTGVSGFIGLELCRLLKEGGHDVVGLIHKNIPPELVSLDVTLLTANLNQPENYQDHLNECDYIVHLAGNPKFGNGPEYEAQNVDTTRALLDAANKSTGKLKRFIFISTIGAIDRSAGDNCSHPLDEESAAFPCSDYGKSKLKAEQLVREAGLAYTTIRPTLVIGNKMRYASHVAVFSRAALNKSLFARINWPGKISIIHVSDLANSIIFVSQHADAENNTYFVAGDDVAIGRIMKQANPALLQINITVFVKMLRLFVRFIPFSLKALLFPALTATDKNLKALGWTCHYSETDGIAEVVRREEVRKNITKSPNGWTLVTGAASGLGMELAIKLQAMGRKLILVDIDKEKLQAVCTDQPDIIRIQCDLSDWQATESVLSREIDSDKSNNILETYLCAGFGLRGEISKLDAEAQANIVRVNVLSRLQLATRYIPAMINHQFGRIIYISSSSAYQPLPFMGVYAASNAAVLSLGESLAYENAENGIEVLTVCPGGMATNFQKSAGVKELGGEKLMTPSEAADIILNSVGKNKQVIMPGFRSFAMALAARVLPRKISLMLWGKLMSVAR